VTANGRFVSFPRGDRRSRLASQRSFRSGISTFCPRDIPSFSLRYSGESKSTRGNAPMPVFATITKVSCNELDLLVDLASANAGAYGAHPVGGGLGGYTVNLVHSDHAAAFAAYIRHARSRQSSLHRVAGRATAPTFDS